MLTTMELNTRACVWRFIIAHYTVPSFFKGPFHEIHETGIYHGLWISCNVYFQTHCRSNQGICKIRDLASTFHGSYCFSLYLQRFCRSFSPNQWPSCWTRKTCTAILCFCFLPRARLCLVISWFPNQHAITRLFECGSDSCRLIVDISRKIGSLQVEENEERTINRQGREVDGIVKRKSWRKHMTCQLASHKSQQSPIQLLHTA